MKKFPPLSAARVRAATALSLAAILAACGGGSAGGSAGASTVDAAATGAIAPATATATAPTSPGSTAVQFASVLSSNASGQSETFSSAGFIDHTNPFFKPFGNGRSCASCHGEAEGWSVTPASVLARFTQSSGNDPLFTGSDGANSPLADLSTADARRAAWNLLLARGLFRIGLPVPTNAEYDLAAVDDPYGYASSKDLSLFRRPLPTTNLRFSAAVMWDGRETYLDPASHLCFAGSTSCYASSDINYGNQANHAVQGHAQFPAGLSDADRNAIVAFEQSLFSAQIFDNAAGSLTGAGASGGATSLAKQTFYFGINDSSDGDYQTHAAFSNQVIRAFDAWSAGANSTAPSTALADADTPPANAAALTAARQSVARGQAIFNGRPIFIDNVAGMPAASVRGSCATCHDTPNAGSRSTPLLFNIGVDAAVRRSADVPLYTLRNKTSGATVQTTDPGLALVSGRWQDIGRFKTPALRGLAARAPYFHDGSAQDLAAVVAFYNERFKIGFTPQEAADLTAFLRSL
ncbi:MAG: cytochrome [Herminiimonas sp.]|nr:cytochrome [Herminiimonas sp.]MDB5852363.1 cytochrome [Herminiimonas sp.]